MSRRYVKHGLTAPRAQLKLRGLAALDRRSTTARTLLAFRADLEQDLGGREALSTQESTIVDLLAREQAYWLTWTPTS